MRRTRPYRILPLVFLILLAPAALGAQEAEPDRQDNCICIDREPGTMGTVFFRDNRARIGVYLGDAVPVDGMTGVEILEVEDDGPAETAGLRDGDIITAVNGTALGEDPGEALVDAIGELEPGDAVEVTYYRDGDRRTVEIVTDEATAFSLRSPRGFQLRSGAMERLGEGLREGLREGLQGQFFQVPGSGGNRAMVWRFGGSDLDLVDLNPGLGEYFGTDRGVLVVDVDDDSLGLEAGDVILSIDGRQVRDAAHVRSILGSYRDDEPITFEIVRHERTREVTGSVGG